MVEVFKQPQYNPYRVEMQVVILWVAQNGFMDDVPVERIKEMQVRLVEFFETRKEELLQKLYQADKISDELTEELKTAATEFKQTFK